MCELIDLYKYIWNITTLSAQQLCNMIGLLIITIALIIWWTCFSILRSIKTQLLDNGFSDRKCAQIVTFWDTTYLCCYRICCIPFLFHFTQALIASPLTAQFIIMHAPVQNRYEFSSSRIHPSSFNCRFDWTLVVGMSLSKPAL